jgi:hypothetical protein
MCLICIEYEKGKLKIDEAVRNLGEMKESVGDEHYDETMAFLTQEMLKKQWDFSRDLEAGLFDDEYWEKIGFGD